jgi:hypothetical protein
MVSGQQVKGKMAKSDKHCIKDFGVKEATLLPGKGCWTMRLSPILTKKCLLRNVFSVKIKFL